MNLKLLINDALQAIAQNINRLEIGFIALDKNSLSDPDSMLPKLITSLSYIR